MRGAVRLSALMRLPVTYVWTHDSIGLGEDGPTHQPIEHLAALRRDPGPRRRPPGRRERDRGRLEADPAQRRPARRADPDPAGAADRAARHRRLRHHRRRGEGRLRPQGLRRARRERDHRRHRLRGAARVAARRGAGRQGVARPRGLDAVPSSGSASRTTSTASRSSRRDVTARVSIEAGVPAAGATSSATPAGSSASTTTAPAPPARCCSRSSASPPRPSSPRRRESLARRRASRGHAAARPHGPSGPQDTGGPRVRRRRHDQLTAAPDPHHPARSKGQAHERDRLKGLADEGVSIWLDDLSRERLNTGNLEGLIKNSSVSRRHHQPDDLRLGAVERRGVQRPGPRARRP